MRFIEEIVVDEFLPTVRGMLAVALAERGLTQREIARAIGVSQSAVSKYVHDDVDRHPAIATDERVQGRVAEVADGLANEGMDPVLALIELEVLIRELEEPGEVLHRLHQEAVPELRSYDHTFRVHDPDSGMRERERVRSSVREAVGRLEALPEFSRLVPQVGTNLVEIVIDGEDLEDVVGVPGRIIDVEGSVAVPGDPRFGVSGHVARVLLAARAGGSSVRAAINVTYEPEVVDRLERVAGPAVEIPGDADVPAAVTEAMTDAPDTTVVAQTGGFGIEPITYVFGADAPAVVDAIERVIDA